MNEKILIFVNMASIGIMDSGVGGLSVFREILKLLPDERYIYFSDNAWCPYGEKSVDFIRERVRSIISLMISKGAEAVVIACNTATSAAAQELRKEFGIPIIGIEPAIKPATRLTRNGTVGVLATAGTLKGNRYHSSKSRFGEDVRIIEHIGEGLVELVESMQLDGPHAEEVIRCNLQPLLDEGADTIVLGCTHYPFLIDSMQKIAGPDILFLDPSAAVARRLVEVLEEKNIGLHECKPDIELISSGNPDSLNKIFKLIQSADL